MNTILVVGVIAAYLLIGVFYARSQAVRVYQRALAEWRYEDIAREGVRFSLAWRVALWPWAVVFDGVRGLFGGWFMSPIDDRRAKAEQLRKDADAWASQARSEHDPDKRTMAEELARMLREQAEEVDL